MSDTAAPLWEVTGQKQDVGQNDAGGLVQGVTIAFKTRSGANGTVFVSNASYTVENARAAINRQATAMETVHNLKG